MDLSALELQNAESKRTFERGGARHLTFSSEGTTTRVDSEGNKITTATTGYSSTAATSVLTKILTTNLLRVGDGPHTMPDSRRASRLFGEKASGRSSLPKLAHARGDEEYNPAQDTCVEAFVRLILARIAAAE